MKTIDLQECWLWAKGKTPSGYGKIAIGSHYEYAHRVIYEALVGKILPNNEIDHLCRIRCCVNPDHLEQTTHKENSFRAGIFRHKADHEPVWIPNGRGRACATCIIVRRKVFA